MPEEHVYDPHLQRCVSHKDLYNMISEDGPTRANLLCLMDCLRYGFHKKDTRISPLRTARAGAPASHDSVVGEVMNRIGPAISDQIGAAIAAALSGFGNGGGVVAPTTPPVVHGGSPASEVAPPLVPAGYGHPSVHQPSVVAGDPDIDPEKFPGLALSEDVTDVAPAPQPKPLTEDELARLRAKLAED